MDENKTNYVLDASVVLKWALIEDENMEQALALRKAFMENRYLIFVPSHFLAEICNTLGRKNSQGTLAFLSKLMLGGVIEHRLTIELAAITLGLTQRHAKVSFYDAFYHAIALKYGIVFITADKKYYEITKGEGNIELLANYAAAV